MVPNLLSALIAICLVCSTVLDGGMLETHAWVPLSAGALLVILGYWANRIDYLKWAGATVIVAGAAVLLFFITGIAAKSGDTAFWVTFWSGNAVGVVSLWSALYRGPAQTP
jgi:hypothetical protein